MQSPTTGGAGSPSCELPPGGDAPVLSLGVWPVLSLGAGQARRRVATLLQGPHGERGVARGGRGKRRGMAEGLRGGAAGRPGGAAELFSGGCMACRAPWCVSVHSWALPIYSSCPYAVSLAVYSTYIHTLLTLFTIPRWQYTISSASMA